MTWYPEGDWVSESVSEEKGNLYASENTIKVFDEKKKTPRTIRKMEVVINWFATRLIVLILQLPQNIILRNDSEDSPEFDFDILWVVFPFLGSISITDLFSSFLKSSLSRSRHLLHLQHSTYIENYPLYSSNIVSCNGLFLS